MCHGFESCCSGRLPCLSLKLKNHMNNHVHRALLCDRKEKETEREKLINK